ncbi:22099_t:CDS:2, partial [Racocetra persica]
PVAESVASSSLKSYLHQKDANSHNKDELKLPKKRDIPCSMVKIVKTISESKVIVDLIFKNSDKDQCIVQLDNIIKYTDEQVNKQIMPSQPILLSKDSYSNVVVFTILYGEKKGSLYLTSTCLVNTSLTHIQNIFTYKDIYNQATAFTLADSNLCTHLLLQVFDLMKQKKWSEAKFL